MEVPVTTTTPLQPLKVKCTGSDCDRGLHCFLTTQKLEEQNQRGACRACGAQLIDWPRLHSRQLADIDYTFASLRRELIRHHFAHVPIRQEAINYARRKGWRGLEEAVLKRLSVAIGPAEPFHDGFQTPREDSKNPIHYAQHGTATCCRRCLQEWYGIPLGVELQPVELRYFTELVMRYLRERLPEITEDGEHVPRRRNSKQDDEA